MWFYSPFDLFFGGTECNLVSNDINHAHMDVCMYVYVWNSLLSLYCRIPLYLLYEHDCWRIQNLTLEMHWMSRLFACFGQGFGNHFHCAAFVCVYAINFSIPIFTFWYVIKQYFFFMFRVSIVCSAYNTALTLGGYFCFCLRLGWWQSHSSPPYTHFVLILCDKNWNYQSFIL